MQRDMDFGRQILLLIEKQTRPGPHDKLKIEGRTDDEFSYHVKLLYQAGLIEATDVSSTDGMHWWPGDLTNAGHDFLDAARDETRWAKAKAIGSKAGAWTFEAIRDILIDLGKDAVKRLLSGGR